MRDKKRKLSNRSAVMSIKRHRLCLLKTQRGKYLLLLRRSSQRYKLKAKRNKEKDLNPRKSLK
jgi:hypothetical protein